MLFYLMVPYPPVPEGLSSWSPLSSSSTRHSFGFASNGSVLFRVGGVDGGGLARSDSAGFSLRSHSWAPAASLPASRSKGCTVSYRNGTILHGFGVDGVTTALSDVWLFDSTRHVWSRVATTGEAPAARHSLSCVLLANEELLIFGGISARGATLADAFVLNGTVWTSLAVSGDVPVSVGSSAAFIRSLAGVVLHGGRANGDISAGVVSAAYFGSVSSNVLSWMPINTAPLLPRAWAGFFTLPAQASLCEVGGYDSVMSSPHALSSIVCLILSSEISTNSSTAAVVSGRWLLLPISSGGIELQPRYAHGAALVNGSLLFVHGGSNGDGVLGDTLFIALPRTSNWLSMIATPSATLSTTVIFIGVLVAIALLLFSTRFFQVMPRLVCRQTRGSNADSSPSQPAPLILLQIRAVAGASQLVIQSLPTFEFHAERDSNAVGTICIICLAAFSDGDKLSTLECVHSFHSDCVSPWLKDNASCPLCRTMVVA